MGRPWTAGAGKSQSPSRSSSSDRSHTHVPSVGVAATSSNTPRMAMGELVTVLMKKRRLPTATEIAQCCQTSKSPSCVAVTELCTPDCSRKIEMPKSAPFSTTMGAARSQRAAPRKPPRARRNPRSRVPRKHVARQVAKTCSPEADGMEAAIPSKIAWTIGSISSVTWDWPKRSPEKTQTAICVVAHPRIHTVTPLGGVAPSRHGVLKQSEPNVTALMPVKRTENTAAESSARGPRLLPGCKAASGAGSSLLSAPTENHERGEWCDSFEPPLFGFPNSAASMSRLSTRTQGKTAGLPHGPGPPDQIKA
mmetsp:Transcript_106394/g.318007  ORF Transcript_106394/g.318007 Transcript_106394/m.318007 type:complete len:308 (-) Transcript_106394:8-931(-)